jgi:RNA polymerase sigma-70 factor (ECF subfamily)
VAVRDLLAAHREPVRGILLRMVRDEALADDLVQEALVRATRATGSLRGDAAPATWLTAIALNLARDHFRAAQRRPQAVQLEHAENLPAPGAPERDILQAEMSECILGHIARLPERQREAVLLHHFAGLGHCDIAALWEISEGNARVILHRGVAALRTSLRRECVLNFSDDVPCERR